MISNIDSENGVAGEKRKKEVIFQRFLILALLFVVPQQKTQSYFALTFSKSVLTS
jgi:hypothetical protein